MLMSSLRWKPRFSGAGTLIITFTSASALRHSSTLVSLALIITKIMILKLQISVVTTHSLCIFLCAAGREIFKAVGLYEVFLLLVDNNVMTS